MLTTRLAILWSFSLPPWARKTLPFAILSALVWSGMGVCSEPRYPVALMNWMVEGSSHALIVDKSRQRLTVWKIQEGEPSLIGTYRCSTGENEGDKWVRGDMKTPEGVYFFCSVIDGRTLPPKYGLWAFTTDYPNFVDRRRGKSGDGIWLHGRDKPLGPKPDSNGCIALENEDLIKVSRYVRLQGTPLIVVKRLKMAPRSAIMEQERDLRDFIEGWRQDWESQDLKAYMSRYSRNFQSCWLDYTAWREKKRKLNKRYKKIRIRLGDVYLYRQNGMVTALFNQDYSSDSYRSSGVKVLYIVHEGGNKIYAEDYHRPVDEAFPVGSLLARFNVRPDENPRRERRDPRIRLVSIDDQEHVSDADVERPRPAAPSRAVVVKTIAAAKKVAVPTIESNKKFVHGVSPDRLIVARIMPAFAPPEPVIGEGDPSGKPTRIRVPMRLPRTAGVADHSAKAGEAKVSKIGPDSHRSPEPIPRKIKRTATLKETESQRLGQPNHSESQELVRNFLSQWKNAWEQKDLDSYVKMYHPDFGSGKTDFKEFAKSRRRYFRKYRTIRVTMERLQIRKVEKQVKVRFLQIFRGDDYSDKGWKNMVLVGGEGKGLRILSEEWSSL